MLVFPMSPLFLRVLEADTTRLNESAWKREQSANNNTILSSTRGVDGDGDGDEME